MSYRGQLAIFLEKSVSEGFIAWGLLTHAFPYEPGLVLCVEGGEFVLSGGDSACSSGELVYIVEIFEGILG